MSEIYFRSINADDIDVLLALEKAATPFAWSKKAHLDSIEQQYPSLLLEADNIPVGFIIFNSFADECHLLNIVVKPEAQGRGFAKKLIERMLIYAKSKGLTQVILEVRTSNLAAIGLYKTLGFQQIGLRKNYYRGNLAEESAREDAIVMQKAL